MTARAPGRHGERPRCRWALATPELRRYHDREYGRPIRNDRAFFERLSLEIFQAGLSWRTVLGKRAALRAALDGFDPKKVSRLTPARQRAFLSDPAVIRNRLKMQAVIHNAGVFLDVQKTFGSFTRYLKTLPLDDRDATVRMFRKKFKFIGPEIVGEFLMSSGWWPVKHEPKCFLYRPDVPHVQG